MSGGGEGVPSTKIDPETLALRGPPARVVRFRRSIVIGLVALASAGVAGAAWIALQPITLRTAVPDQEEADPRARAPADALADAPRSYGDVPRLGPKLPGDLGRPILAHQRAAGAAVPPGPDAALQAVETERQRVAAEQRAARQSAILMPMRAARAADLPALDPARSVADEAAGGRAGSGVSGAGSGQGKGTDPARERMPSGGGLVPLRSPWTLSAGSVIPASLMTGVNSDLPGMVIAQVTQNVFDSATGRTLLVPQGSRLIGNYDSVVAFGQRRALVLWQRLILPDGSSLELDHAPAADPAGYAGLAGEVDFHSWRLLKGVAIATLLGVGTELSLGGESDLVAALRDSAQSNIARAGDQITRRNLDIPPTITVRPGTPVRLIVNRDLVLAPWDTRP
ncbi:MAG TPA: TrbI/VirB10 family protein [Sphingomonas sp.]|nr:TrbI/VirB10 family protein [Sphingomonas sp.]